MLRKTMEKDHTGRILLEELITRKRNVFGDDVRVTGEYNLRKIRGEWRLRADARDSSGIKLQGKRADLFNIVLALSILENTLFIIAQSTIRQTGCTDAEPAYPLAGRLQGVTLTDLRSQLLNPGA